MKKIITEDNSTTFYNEMYNETYHSTTGAEEEAVKKFVEPCKNIINNNKVINILDICFGLGYNSAAAIDEIRKRDKNSIINIIALENDKEILKKIRNISSTFRSYLLIKELINSKDLTMSKDNINIKIILDDAKKSIKRLKEKFDIIFLDPFSPKKCPELWTEEFLRDIKRLTHESIITTYSCAKIVRKNLEAAGFKTKDGPCIGRKSPSTIAFT